MGILKVFLIIIEVFASVLLIGVILLQKAKDEGLGLAFGAAMGETLFGSRAGNVLSKITIGLAIVFLVNTLLIGLLTSGAGGGGARSVTDGLPSLPAAPIRPTSPLVPAAGDEATPLTLPESAPGPVAVPAPTPITVPAPAPAPAPAAP